MRPEIIEGDVRKVLKTLDDESVQCVVTSPPYWGLRDYGTATWEGGDKDCEHTICDGTYDPKKGTLIERPDRNADRSVCIQCGAKRIDAQLGLENTPEEYVENLVSVFQEVKRVLRKDGTVWLNLGDSYFSKPKSNYNGKSEGLQSKSYGTGETELGYKKQGNKFKKLMSQGYKNKDLVGIPWRVALALQADGWYLRSDIIWAKGSCMPEPVTDRPTKSHEYIFLLTKSAKYYYDYEAIKEQGAYPAGTKGAKGSVQRSSTNLVNSRPPEYKIYNGTRNKRTVWTINPKPYREAHFATFPEELPETCIKAGTSKAGCCADCGAPVERITERQVGDDMSWAGRGPKNEALRATGKGDTRGTTMNIGSKEDYYKNQPRNVTLAWEPSCNCNAERVPCIVLDIFAGSGTTLRVASKLGRKGIGIELNPEYIKILKKRCKIESVSLEAFG